MTRDVVTVLPTATLTEAARTLAEHALRGVPVCEPDGTLVGIISACDLIRPPEHGQQQHRHDGWLHHLADRTHFAEEFVLGASTKVATRRHVNAPPGGPA
jgi:CBS-domain-containing membrane protein